MICQAQVLEWLIDYSDLTLEEVAYAEGVSLPKRYGGVLKIKLTDSSSLHVTRHDYSGGNYECVTSVVFNEL